MSLHTETIDYYDNEVCLQGFLVYDTCQLKPAPGILISHAWGGRNEFVCDKARELAEQGYVAFALDMYGKGVIGKDVEESARLMQPFIDNRAMLQQRINSALYTLKQIKQVDSERIAAMGYCFGGLCVLDLVRSGADLRGVISFHGLLNPPENPPDKLDKQDIRTKILIFHGQDDPMSSPQTVQAIQTELTGANADWQFHSYSQTMHAFTNPVANDPDFGTVYNPVADRRSWQSALNFLTEIMN